MGAPEEVIAQYLQAEQENQDFEVLADNWQAVQVFLAMATQWNTSVVPVQGGFVSSRTGLNYQALDAVMKWFGVTDSETVFQQIQTMEYAALEEMNKS